MHETSQKPYRIFSLTRKPLSPDAARICDCADEIGRELRLARDDGINAGRADEKLAYRHERVGI